MPFWRCTCIKRPPLSRADVDQFRREASPERLREHDEAIECIKRDHEDRFLAACIRQLSQESQV